MGHSEGICHMYVDSEASVDKVTRLGELTRGSWGVRGKKLLVNPLCLRIMCTALTLYSSSLQSETLNVNTQPPVMPWRRCLSTEIC